jgi:hypothetical protein
MRSHGNVAGHFGALHRPPMSGNVPPCNMAAVDLAAGCRRHGGEVLECRHEGFEE